MPTLLKDLHSVLKDYTNAELKQIPVLPQSRLEQGAKYIDLRTGFTAMGIWKPDLTIGMC